MRAIDKIIVHCSDSDYIHHDNIKVIRDWHIKERGWSDVGYHFLITSEGGLWVGRPIDKAGAHCRGQNANSIGICLTGSKIFMEKQFETLNKLCNNLYELLKLSRHDVYGHSDFNESKTCPNFNLKEKLKKEM